MTADIVERMRLAYGKSKLDYQSLLVTNPELSEQMA